MNARTNVPSDGLLAFARRLVRAFPPGDVVRVMAPHRALEMLLRYGLHLHRRDAPDDLERRDPELLSVALELVRGLGRHWFRAEVEGVEHVPTTGPALLVGNHNGGFLTFDTYLTLLAIADRQGLQRAVRPLAHDFVFDDPLLRDYAFRFGAMRATHAGAERAFARNDLVLVYPGGDLDTFRRFSQRQCIELGARAGFVRLALRARVPIVPVVSAGTHEQFVVLARGDSIARLFMMRRWARTETFPIALALPWGITSGFLPYLPLPAQTTVAFGPPLAWPELAPNAWQDDTVVRRCRGEVVAAMQTLLDRISLGRRPWLGRPEALRANAVPVR